SGGVSMNELGVCIVGCGMISRFHIRALSEIPGTRVAALVDSVSGAPQRLAEEMKLTGVSYHSDVAGAVRQPGVDIVIICTPSGAHMDPALMAANAGKHVVVEK